MQIFPHTRAAILAVTVLIAVYSDKDNVFQNIGYSNFFLKGSLLVSNSLCERRKEWKRNRFAWYDLTI